MNSRSQVVWITGASSGIGAALARGMARSGAIVAGSARGVEDLQRLAQSVCGAGTIHPYPLDISDPEATGEVVARIERDHGPIGQAVLNAGTHRPVDPRRIDASDFRALVEVNLMGTVHCLQSIVPRMVERRRGRVAIVGSVAGYRGLPTSSAYGMTKAGLINLAEALRVELAATGIVVQLASPGFVRTPLTDRNPFRMPMLMEPEAAAEALRRGLGTDRFEIVFPWRFAMLMKLLRCLPAPIAFAVTRRMIPKERDVDGRG